MSAQNETYTVVGGPVEAFDAKTSGWVKKARGSEVADTDFVRSASSFSLRGKRGMSETYSQCDCTLVASLKPQKKAEVSRRSNDVISRDIFDAGFLLAPASLKVRKGATWKFDIVKTADDGQEFGYEVSAFPDWLVIDNPKGVLTGKVTITGKVDAEKAAAFVSSGAHCTVVCNGKTLELPVICTE